MWLYPETFHIKSFRQQVIMERFKKSHEAHINIKGILVINIVIVVDPILLIEKEIAGYVGMLINVTIRVLEEQKMIEELSCFCKAGIETAQRVQWTAL